MEMERTVLERDSLQHLTEEDAPSTYLEDLLEEIGTNKTPENLKEYAQMVGIGDSQEIYLLKEVAYWKGQATAYRTVIKDTHLERQMDEMMSDFPTMEKRQGFKSSSDSFLDLSDDAVLGKVPPQGIEIEEVILATYTTQGIHQYIKPLDKMPELFYRDAHRLIMESLLELNNFSELILLSKLREKGYLEAVGGAYSVNRMVKRAESNSALFNDYLDNLHQNYKRRQVLNITRELNQEAYDDSIMGQPDAKIEEGAARLYELLPFGKRVKAMAKTIFKR
ncbi:MAG: hypothetical protein KC535_02410 [Nanoarchaeota archaeon]|nr:hypothetical protein [Nanoarchaeota archaeon]